VLSGSGQRPAVVRGSVRRLPQDDKGGGREALGAGRDTPRPYGRVQNMAGAGRGRARDAGGRRTWDRHKSCPYGKGNEIG
jgi:hypothetical protein